jgi:uncharacterized membrane protein YfcA
MPAMTPRAWLFVALALLTAAYLAIWIRAAVAARRERAQDPAGDARVPGPGQAALGFVTNPSYSLRPALGLALGGIPGVLVAAYIVRELSLTAVRWLVVVVVVYAAVSRLRSARAEARVEPPAPEPGPSPLAGTATGA